MLYDLKNTNLFKKYGLLTVKKIQILGLKDCKKIFCGDGDVTYEAFKKVGINPQILQFPMVYKETCALSLSSKIKLLIKKNF